MSFIDQLKVRCERPDPAIIQEQKTGRVLMMAWMNRASLEKTVETGKTHFWSRSRQKFWMKGESSGHTQAVKDIAFDCDGDTLLIQVEQIGAACHEGYQSCFFRSVAGWRRGLQGDRAAARNTRTDLREERMTTGLKAESLTRPPHPPSAICHLPSAICHWPSAPDAWMTSFHLPAATTG